MTYSQNDTDALWAAAFVSGAFDDLADDDDPDDKPTTTDDQEL